MSFFENENVKRGWKSKKRFFLVALIIIVISVLCYFWGASIVKEKSKTVEDLENIISLKEPVREKINKKTKLTIYHSPFLLADKEDSSEAFYIVSNGKYFYIAKMYKSIALSITDLVAKNGFELVGYTSEVPDEVKQFAIDEYNKSYEDEKITLDDYNSYFGDVCIDLVKQDSVLAPLQYSIFYIGLIIGSVLILVAIIMMISYKVKTKKIKREDIDILSEEINGLEAVYFEKGKVYLTNNYIIDVANLEYFKYEDIDWVYKHIQRVNGIVSYKALMLYTTDGKQHMLCMNAGDNYEKIMEELVARNNNIRVGYNQENQQIYKDKKRELKEQKKQEKAAE